MNLYSTIGATYAYKPPRAVRYDVGNGEFLTVPQIAARTGTKESGIYQRIKKGQRGKELLRGPRTKLFEVGDGRRLSIKQIADETGLSVGAVYSRIARGLAGKDLLVKNGNRRRRGMARSPTQHIAFKLAWAFGRELPTTKEIMRVQPMSHTSAMRWRNAMAKALDAA